MTLMLTKSCFLLCFGLSSAIAQDGVQVLNSFQNDANGVNPGGTLVETQPGTFVGATTAGENGSTLFQVSSSGVFKVLLNFNPDAQGYDSVGQIYPASNGLLYGVNDSGNGAYTGSIFAASTNGQLRILQSNSKQASPLIEAADGNLYGVEENASTGDYSVFRMTLAGAITDIYDLGQNGQSAWFVYPTYVFTNDGFSSVFSNAVARGLRTVSGK